MKLYTDDINLSGKSVRVTLTAKIITKNEFNYDELYQSKSFMVVLMNPDFKN